MRCVSGTKGIFDTHQKCKKELSLTLSKRIPFEPPVSPQKHKKEVFMDTVPEEIEWSRLSPEEKKAALFNKQKRLLDMFLSRNAISQQQYDKSLGDLRTKMGIS